MPATGPLPPRDAFGDSTLAPGDRAVRPTVYPKAIAVVATVASLYFGRDIFIPLAIAVLLTFALAPLVSFLRRFHLPRPVAAARGPAPPAQRMRAQAARLRPRRPRSGSRAPAP